MLKIAQKAGWNRVCLMIGVVKYKVMNWFKKIQLFIRKEWFLLVMIGVLSLLIFLFEILK